VTADLVTADTAQQSGVPRLANILLAEDDPGDAGLIRRAFSESKLALNLMWVEDGEEALRYLRRESEFADACRPDLVLLDLNMPKVDGKGVLAAVREDPLLTDLPVVILTTSRADEDVLASYRLHANAYVSKPIGLAGLVQIVETLQDFWFSIVVLPSKKTVRHVSAAG
jgi:two-component system, chemotaxis family, response regulator Rcp1